MLNLKNKKILIILAYHGYQDHEFKTVKDYLVTLGAQVDIASTNIGVAQGKLGGFINIDFLFSDIEINNYNAVIFIGGPGAEELKDNKDAKHLAQIANRECDLLAAICIAPVILANAGVLRDKKATVFITKNYQQPAEELINYGAEYVNNQSVVEDENIITANGPQAAQEFVELITKKLS